MIPSPQNACAFGAEIIIKHLRAMRKEVDGVRQAQDIECIHRMRVASRRLRTALRLFQFCFPDRYFTEWYSVIRKVTSALTTARDLDVQIDFLKSLSAEVIDPKQRPGLRRVILRLLRKRGKQKARINKCLDKLLQDNVLEDIENASQSLCVAPIDVPPVPQTNLYDLAYNAIRQRLKDVLSYEEFLTQVNRVEELHLMRIAAKDLRYTMETFSLLYGDQIKSSIQLMRDIQDNLGSIHDCDVWIQLIPIFLKREKRYLLKFYGHTRPFYLLVPGILYVQQNRQLERNQLYERFVKDWRVWKDTGLWSDILRIIQPPTVQTIPTNP